MVGKTTDSPSSNGMTEELLTSRFGSHESVCKPDQPDLGQVMAGRQVQTGKVDQLRRNIYKVNPSEEPPSVRWPIYMTSLLWSVFSLLLQGSEQFRKTKQRVKAHQKG